MRGIFETAEGAIFVRNIEEALPEIRFVVYNRENYFATEGDEFSVGAVLHTIRRHRLYDRCQHIAFYREVVA